MRTVKIPTDVLSVGRCEVAMLPLFGPDSKTNGSVDMGYAVFGPGSRVPEEGYGRHDQDEFAYVISGRLRCDAGGRQLEVGPGNATFIPAGEAHYSWNDSGEPCKLVYMLVDKH